MKDFIKNSTWIDWLLMATVLIFIIGFLLFIIGFFWNFDFYNKFIDESTQLQKTSVHKILNGKDSFFINFFPNIDTSNLFNLAGDIDSSMNPLYGMVVVSILGFSLIMLGILIILTLIITSITLEYIIPMLKKKKNK